ncbi:hypothetical protein B296_00052717 [Ensete ventricosum]|uniref:Uncharacterized protein n=1 Tax=Ensete ventricosum TaxID=4639 RepID=A0A426X0F0_ENSVE|nr:hypothetical protein B296_00052717 [Ensete ventricosum]
MSMWLRKDSGLLRFDYTTSRRVDSDSHRLEPVVRATKPPSKSNNPRGLAIDFYQTTTTGFSRATNPTLFPFPPPRSCFPISSASDTPRPPHPAASIFSPDLLAWEPHILISSVVEWASQVRSSAGPLRFFFFLRIGSVISE